MKYVLYHAGCTDGLYSALCFYWLFGKEAEYIPSSYDKELKVTFNKEDELYIVDFSFKRLYLIELSKQISKITLIDHHKTAKEDLENITSELQCNSEIVFDETHSGAVLCYNYVIDKLPAMSLFHSDAKEFFEYVEDRDLWNWAKPNSREFSAWLSTKGNDFDECNKVVAEFNYIQNRPSIFNKGAGILEYQAAQIKRISKNHVISQWHGFTVATLNTPTLQSEIGEYLLTQKPEVQIVGMWYEDETAAKRWSLRARKTDDVDTTIISTIYGGGGHIKASGFTIKKE